MISQYLVALKSLNAMSHLSLQIKTKAKTDFKEGKRATKLASAEEVRSGTCANLRDVRFFGAWVPAIWDKQESIPRRLLGEVMELVANSYDPVE